MDAANIRNVFQSRYDRKPSTWSKIGIPHERLENIDLDLVVDSSATYIDIELSRCTSRNIPFKIRHHRSTNRSS